jgi:hypothetical protein
MRRPCKSCVKVFRWEGTPTRLQQEPRLSRAGTRRRGDQRRTSVFLTLRLCVFARKHDFFGLPASCHLDRRPPLPLSFRAERSGVEKSGHKLTLHRMRNQRHDAPGHEWTIRETSGSQKIRKDVEATNDTDNTNRRGKWPCAPRKNVKCAGAAPNPP